MFKIFQLIVNIFTCHIYLSSQVELELDKIFK